MQCPEKWAAGQTYSEDIAGLLVPCNSYLMVDLDKSVSLHWELNLSGSKHKVSSQIRKNVFTALDGDRVREDELVLP